MGQKIGMKIRERRIQLGISQNELANRVGMLQSRISQIENLSYGKMSLSSLEPILNELGYDLVLRKKTVHPESARRFLDSKF